MKLLIHLRTGKTYLTDRDSYNTEFGLVHLNGDCVFSSTGELFLVTDPWFVDLWRRVRRGPQITHWKDLGLIASLTGIGEGWRIVEAGSGSGFSTCFFARLVGKTGHVFSYERNPRFLRLAKENVERCGLADRVTFKNADIYEGIEESGVHMVFLDLPEPWNAFKSAERALLPAGFLVCYVPTAEQVIRCSKELPPAFTPFSVYETVVREWKRPPTTRPINTGILHTAFVLVSRKGCVPCEYVERKKKCKK